ncbi:MAG: YihY/virulence factor BrkB family protein [Clostridiales bacterium]|nr:YihY/virulence factor BrkB family protein [Clostridiales bacterium]
MKRKAREACLFLFIVGKKFMDNELFYMANALTYRMIMAFFPFLIFLLSMFRFVNIDSSAVLISMIERLPEGFSSLVINFIDNAALSNTFLSVTLIYGIWSATRGFHAIIEGMNRCSAVKESRNFIILWLSSFVLVFIFTAYIFLSLAMVVFDENIINLLNTFMIFKSLAYTLQTLPLGILNCLLTVALVLVFYEFSAARKFTFKELLPGAVFTIAAWIALSKGLGLYMQINTNAFSVYGSIAGIFITIFWVNLLASTLLLGAQLNAVILKYKDFRRQYVRLYKQYIKGFEKINFLRGFFDEED